MMDWTDRHDRYFLRLLSRQVLLYTEMLTTGAVIHGDRDRLLGFDAAEHPVALQLGGSDPDELARAAAIGEQWGYDEINLNVGCPSDRVLSGRFGACLMAEPRLVRECVAAMSAAVAVPVTVKTRIGIDRNDSYAALAAFVETVATSGCDVFIIHARKAWLNGLSPRENRELPPLRYEVVHCLKRDFSGLKVVINGGLTSLDAGARHLEIVDGFMLGRAAYKTPYLLATVDQRFYGAIHPVPDRREIVERLLPYTEEHLRRGGQLGQVARHVLGLFHGCPRARLWRRHISENAFRRDAGCSVLETALALVEGGSSTPTQAA